MRVRVGLYGHLYISRLFLSCHSSSLLFFCYPSLPLCPPASLPPCLPASLKDESSPYSSISSTKKLKTRKKRQENRLRVVILFVARRPALCWVEELSWYWC